MKIFITGATGFVGLNLVQALLEHHGDDATLIAMHRPESRIDTLAGQPVTLAVGDVTDRASLDAAMPGDVDVVYHVAADVSFWHAHARRQLATNVVGTDNVIAAALARRVTRFVHVSSVAAYAPRPNDELVETLERSAQRHWISYVATKWASEQAVLKAVARGLPAVVVQPGNILGPLDTRNWAQLFWHLEAGHLPGTPPGGAPWCHVASLARAMISAAERGRVGERYLIAAEHARYAQVIGAVAQMLGKRAPPVVPALLLRAVGEISGWASLLTRREPTVTPEKAYFASLDFRADCAKARRELGYVEVGVEQMLHDTHRWLVDTHVL